MVQFPNSNMSIVKMRTEIFFKGSTCENEGDQRESSPLFVFMDL